MRITHYLLLSALAAAVCQCAVFADELDGAGPAGAVLPEVTLMPASAPLRLQMSLQLSLQPVVAAAPPADLFGAQPLALERLDGLRGGADTVSNDMNLSGTVANNTAVNVVSGMNTISNGSFSNASGLPVAIQNSGANVLIQNATIINVQLQ
jgi:hypothetical protein